jgi:isocitrate dehydrogenase (NAD+)
MENTLSLLFLGMVRNNSKVTEPVVHLFQGIGPEISQAVKDIYTAAGVPIQWEEVSVTPVLKGGKTVIPDAAIESVKRNTVALKGPLATPSEFCVSVFFQCTLNV